MHRTLINLLVPQKDIGYILTRIGQLITYYSYLIYKGMSMLKSILGSRSRERILIFIAAREQGYAREISQFWKCPDRPIKRELNILESDGVLVSTAYGRTISYSINPRFFLKKELMDLLLRAIEAYKPELKENLLFNRRRPRAKGKPVVMLDTQKKTR